MNPMSAPEYQSRPPCQVSSAGFSKMFSPGNSARDEDTDRIARQINAQEFEPSAYRRTAAVPASVVWPQPALKSAERRTSLYEQ
jgi:hypothetical protein